MRTTIDIDDPILRELKRRQKREGKSLGRVVSDLLARALAETETGEREPVAFRWIARPMGARIDLADQHAMLDAMDERRRP
jgi:hypothetical protein